MKFIKYLVILFCFISFRGITKEIDFSKFDVSYGLYGQFPGDYKGKLEVYQGWEAWGDKKEVIKLYARIRHFKGNGRVVSFQRPIKHVYGDRILYSIYFVYVGEYWESGLTK